MSDAEILLLTLEVEAAAARNADLSHRVEELQSLLLSTTRTAEHQHERPTFVNASTQVDCTSNPAGLSAPPDAVRLGCHCHPTQQIMSHGEGEPVVGNLADDDVTMAMVNLDDALFDIAEIMSLLYPAHSSDPYAATETMSSRRRNLVGGQVTLAELTHSFLGQVKALKTAFSTRLETFNARAHAMEAEFEQARRQLTQTISGLEDEKAQLVTRLRQLEVALGTRLPEELLTAEECDILKQYKEANAALTLENQALRNTLSKLQNDLTLKL